MSATATSPLFSRKVLPHTLAPGGPGTPVGPRGPPGPCMWGKRPRENGSIRLSEHVHVHNAASAGRGQKHSPLHRGFQGGLVFLLLHVFPSRES